MMNLTLVFYMFGFLLVFLLANEAIRRYKKPALIAFILCLPCLFLPNSDLFMSIKTASVLIPLCALIFARFKPNKTHYYFRFIYFVIILNIIEASVIDYMSGNALNMIVAAGLMFLLPFSLDKWKISGQYDDFVVDLPKLWPLLYTTWNLCFLYSYRITTFGYALPLLLAPLLYIAYTKRSDLYFQTRAYTFGFYLAVRAVMGETNLMNLSEFDLSTWYHQEVAIFWCVINILLTAAAIYLYRNKKSKN